MLYISFIVLTFVTTVLTLPINYFQGYQNMYYPPPPPPPILPGYYQSPPPLPPTPPSLPVNYPTPSALPPSVTWEQFSDCLNKICQDDLDECIPECMKPVKNKDDDDDHDKVVSNKEEA